MEVVEVNKTRKEEWNRFVAKNPYGSFLQGYEWSQFQQSLGRDCWKLKVKSMPRTEKEFLVRGEKHAPYRKGVPGSGLKVVLAQALVVKYNLPFGKSYLYCPHGPIIDSTLPLGESIAVFKTLAKKIKEISQKENAIFWRMDPAIPETGEEKEIFRNLGLQKLSREIQPKKTLVLDLTKSEKELLSQMHYKTRYNIRLAKKRGVTVKKIPNSPSSVAVLLRRTGKFFTRQSFSEKNLGGQVPNLIDTFWGLLRKTARRDEFRTHPKQYYQKMLENFPQAKFFLAEYKKRIIAGNIVVFFGKRAAYLHGASDYEYRNLMAPYLLQWHQILEAKKKGLDEYDFWGIDEKKWPGVTRFKKGFGGKEINYMGVWDLIYQPVWYRIYNLARKVASTARKPLS